MKASLKSYLRKLRIDLDLSQKLMADALGITPAYLSLIENGQRPPPDYFEDRLISAFNLTEGQRSELDEVICSVNTDVKISTEGDGKNHLLLTKLKQNLNCLKEQTKDKILDIIDEA